MTREKTFPLSLAQITVKKHGHIKNKRLSQARQESSHEHSVSPPGRADTLQSTSQHKPRVTGLGLDSERARHALIERLQSYGINDRAVLQAIATIPRHLFVDSGLASQAYEDTALPIGYEQTISKPSIVAYMVSHLRQNFLPEQRLQKVLEIGTGCGYQAAVLSQLAREVYSIERIKPLFEKAKQNLRPLRLANVRLHHGDGTLGLPQAAPFDAIIVAAAGMAIPEALLNQLALGGRLIAPIVQAQNIDKTIMVKRGTEDSTLGTAASQYNSTAEQIKPSAGSAPSAWHGRSSGPVRQNSATPPGRPCVSATAKPQVLKLIERQSDTLFQETILESVLFVPLKSGIA